MSQCRKNVDIKNNQLAPQILGASYIEINMPLIISVNNIVPRKLHDSIKTIDLPCVTLHVRIYEQ
jgi:hypothetical protein